MIFSIKKQIPNAFTLGNLLCGCLGINACYNHDLLLAGYFILLGAFFDFFDGFAARMLKVSSPMGKELDSLSDMVTFGVLPGVIMFHLFMNANSELQHIAWIIPLASAYRLAKFNVDTRQSDQFLGIPTPASALFIGSLPFIDFYMPRFQWSIQEYLLVAVSVVLSILMVSSLPLIALKFKDFGWKGNELRYIFLLLILPFVVLFKFAAIPLLIFCYILLSFIGNLLNLQKSN